jgi:hypothetical protein
LLKGAAVSGPPKIGRPSRLRPWSREPAPIVDSARIDAEEIRQRPDHHDERENDHDHDEVTSLTAPIYLNVPLFSGIPPSDAGQPLARLV